MDVDLFRPDRAIDLGFARPIFIDGRARRHRKNLEAFLSLDLPGTKVVIGAGPHEAILKRSFPQAKFLGPLDNGTLAAHLAAADVVVFRACTDTFGIVQLEALASGVPIAAFQSPVRRTWSASAPIGVSARRPRASPAWTRCRFLATPAASSRCDRSWESSARQFLGHVQKCGRRPARAKHGLARPVHDDRGHGPADTAPRCFKAKDAIMTYLSHTELDKADHHRRRMPRWAPVLRSRVSARCSNAGGRPRSPPPSASAGASSRSAMGTGMSLRGLFAPDCRLCGIDISEPMLRKARSAGRRELGTVNVEGLWVMDAEHLYVPGRRVRRDRGAST